MQKDGNSRMFICPLQLYVCWIKPQSFRQCVEQFKWNYVLEKEEDDGKDDNDDDIEDKDNKDNKDNANDSDDKNRYNVSSVTTSNNKCKYNTITSSYDNMAKSDMAKSYPHLLQALRG